MAVAWNREDVDQDDGAENTKVLVLKVDKEFNLEHINEKQTEMGAISSE